jgi:hypothetical protein
MNDARRLARALALLAAPLVLSCHATPHAAEPDAASLLDRPHVLAAALVPAGPVALTATDGTGLHLRSLRGHVVLQGPLAFTELEVAFENPEERVLEGTFRVALPQRATIARFAMRMAQGWQEGEVVERQRAREAYEDALHHKQDPALLEQSSGNEFSARVFPIPPLATKEITVAWVQELTGDTPYVLPLRGLPELEVLDVDASVPGLRAPLATISHRAWTPAQDLVVARPASGDEGLRSGELALVRVRPVVAPEPDAIGSAVVLFDTSASRALGFAKQVDALSGLLGRLSPEAHLTVACFDQSVEEVFDGEAREFGDAAKARIRARGAMGASNVAGALGWARNRAAKGGAKRVALITDGVATAGATDAASLASAARALRESGVERVDVVAVGGIRDDAAMRAVVTAGLAHDGVVAEGGEGSAAVARRFDQATRSHLAVNIEGARWWWPREIDGAQAGDETLVYAEIDPARPVAVSLGGAAARAARLADVDRPLLERAWAQAKVASFVEKQSRPGSSPELERAILDLSISQRLLGPATAMVVLESESDYARFGIDRSAAANVLVADAGRVVRTSRARVALDGPPMPVANRADADGYGYSFEDDPLSGGSFGPSDATIRVVPGPVRTVRAPRLDASSGFSARQYAQGGPATHLPLDFGGAGPRDSRPASGDSLSWANRPEEDTGAAGPAYSGLFAEVMAAIARNGTGAALATATRWRDAEPGDVMALVATGEALEAAGATQSAARAYGSLIDLFPSRADLRRFAGERLERLHDDAALDLAIDTYTRAVEERPDHPSSHRLLTFALLRRGRHAQAFDAGLAGLAYSYPAGRFLGVDRVLREDLGLIAAAWTKSEPARAADIRARLAAAGGTLEDEPSLRFVLTWETDANDVDLHVVDAQGHHAYYDVPTLPTGGELYADVRTGYGPECFTVRGPAKHRAAPYSLYVDYYARGPMGYGMGKVEVIEHDGSGAIGFDERPFVVMNDHASVQLGKTP